MRLEVFSVPLTLGYQVLSSIWQLCHFFGRRSPLRLVLLGTLSPAGMRLGRGCTHSRSVVLYDSSTDDCLDTSPNPRGLYDISAVPWPNRMDRLTPM